MTFDKELAILYGCLNFRISKNKSSRKKPQWSRKYFFLISHKNAYDFVQYCQFLCFKPI